MPHKIFRNQRDLISKKALLFACLGNISKHSVGDPSAVEKSAKSERIQLWCEVENEGKIRERETSGVAGIGYRSISSHFPNLIKTCMSMDTKASKYLARKAH